ncbi:MAG: hypothetical protein M3R69_14280 [Acidobacteriota bacterium]|nr:hypothetical protein [Acidobacteriota bacterium]
MKKALIITFGGLLFFFEVGSADAIARCPWITGPDYDAAHSTGCPNIYKEPPRK